MFASCAVSGFLQDVKRKTSHTNLIFTSKTHIKSNTHIYTTTRILSRVGCLATMPPKPPFSRTSLSHREKRKHTKRAICCIVFLFFSLAFRVLFFGKSSSRGRHLNDEYGREPLYAFGTHHTHHQFLQKSPHEYALSMARGEESFHHRPHNQQEGLSVSKSEEEEEEEQKQFSLANTKVYVYSSREISEIAKLAPKDCERVESEQLLHRMFLYSTQLRTSEKSEATHFFVPAYPECLRTQKKLDEKTIEGYYVDVLKRLGRFQMSGGLDHVFVAPRVGMDAVFPNWRAHCANCLFLRASRDVRGQTTDVFREVVIPDAFSESEARKNDETAEKLKSKRQSHALISVLGDDDEAKRLRRIHKVSDTEDMRFRASFCVVIVPNDAEGDEDIDERNHWTKNIALALWSDCIPVLLHKKNANANDDDDHFAHALLDALPLSDVLDYESFSISQAYKANTDDDELLDYLRAINARDRHEFARNGKRVRCAFVYDAGDSECSAALALGFALGKRGLQFPKSSKSFWGAHGVPLDGDGNIVSASSSSSSSLCSMNPAAATLKPNSSSRTRRKGTI